MAVLASVVVLLGSVGAGAETLTINTGILAATDTDVFAIHVFQPERRQLHAGTGRTSDAGTLFPSLGRGTSTITAGTNIDLGGTATVERRLEGQVLVVNGTTWERTSGSLRFSTNTLTFLPPVGEDISFRVSAPFSMVGSLNAMTGGITSPPSLRPLTYWERAWPQGLFWKLTIVIC
jgi:hypothetical protein